MICNFRHIKKLFNFATVIITTQQMEILHGNGSIVQQKSKLSFSSRLAMTFLFDLLMFTGSPPALLLLF